MYLLICLFPTLSNITYYNTPTTSAHCNEVGGWGVFESQSMSVCFTLLT